MVTFVWDLPDGQRSERAVTDWGGEAIARRSLAGLSPGTALRVDVLAEYNGQSRQRSTIVDVP